MMDVAQQAGGFEDILPVLMIFAVIIAQIVKAGRTMSKGGKRPPLPPGPERGPGDELREFLETLTGARALDEPEGVSFSAAPPPPSPEPRRARADSFEARPARPRVVAAPAVEAREERAPVKRPETRGVVTAGRRLPAGGSARDERGEESGRERARPGRKTLLQQLSARESLAQAIVLKEILGEPVSLRSRW